ncbi:thioredoxin domain-containing protein [Hoeflea prorocentri]|uniref:Thioredoxin domain-containing protein n=1 Tax=Hoeflea prorocentri TaxID=1922333 RepID=A0A9X3UHI7_9HYPH|nr:thioredoxin domain-containing protein [Hoeflea prorocentri]MCY6380769.1 thioredoxin domain-containing protein [Hoeflea prorocentri]MDA5398569.1 thioredoxin domain-containing protein [Hoeflea prorocentri]
MKKHGNSNRSSRGKSKEQKKTGQTPDKGRRNFLRLARNGAIGVVAVGGVGVFFVQNVRSSMHEHDLSRITNGKPTVVQIHDPQCTMCLALQKQARRALNQFDDNEIDYVVANIRTNEGRALADQYGVPHVTLLLFDEKGEHKSTLRGQRQSRELATAFRLLVSG